ncbi:MAG: M48 family metalloprotease [Acidobacteria bacterium]|nr:M48 family metalloprotease [Acidobacteriota bacterium]MCL5288605.1 M48 family metalloprotease [Acidobacteriota bacterium]
MNMRVLSSVGTLVLAFGLSAPPITAQQGCPVPNFQPSPKERIIFSEQQEMDLGDAITEHLQRNFRVIDDQVTEYLQQIGDRLTAPLPKGGIRYRFLLVDIPVANAFTLAGGRVYVTRKLVAQTRSEDELAGVLGHEIGHSLMRENAIRLSRWFEKVIGVTQVGNRKDIFEKYNLLIDNVLRKPGALRTGEREQQEGQLDADRAGLFLVAQAGYSPQAVARFWDRSQEVKGKTGSALGDFFGFTSPEQKRLRELLKQANAMPESCTVARTAPPAAEYQKWQAAVVAYSGLGRRESLHAVISRQVLDPPLQDDINHLKFSADGKLILAQNDASIYVLSREPLASLFRIDAPEAYPAQFSPDNKSVVFHRPDLRVERWNIEDELRTDVFEMTIPKGCMQSALSPDGRFLACLSGEFALGLYTVADGALAYQKKNFFIPDPFQALFLMILAEISEEDITISWVRMGFSPDAHYFVAAYNEDQLAFDLTTKAPISLPGSIKRLLGRSFAFYDGGRLMGRREGDSKGKAMLVKFPSGEVISEVIVGSADVSAPAKGNYVVVRPIEKYALGVMDLETSKIFVANRTNAFDIYDKVWVSERRSGEIALYSREFQSPIDRVVLPRSTLGPLRATALSPDMKYLAISQKSRGGVWKLDKSERIFHLRGFRGAYIGDDGAVYADFPKFEKTERKIAVLRPSNRETLDGPNIEEDNARQYGEFLVLIKPNKKNGGTQKNVTLEVQDVRTRKVMWSRAFPKERPGTYIGAGSPTMVLWWHLNEGHAKDTIKNDPGLKARQATMNEKEGDYLLEVVEAGSGKTLGKLLIETGKGSFHIERTYAVGDHVVIVDSSNRVQVYSLASGEQKGRVFGQNATVSLAGQLLCVENETGQLAVYDLARMEKRDQFVFSHPVSLVRFSPDGKRLFVLTNDQTTYLLDLSAPAAVNR